MYKANYHTHMRFCNHAVGDVKDYVEAAIKYGLIELGMTDHGPIPSYFMNEEDYKRTISYENMKEEEVSLYLKQIEDCQKIYGNKIKILSGFEVEFLEKQKSFYENLRKKVDYLNLGIHFYEYNGKLYDTYNEVTYDSFDGYLETVKKALNTNIFNTLVHPDLFMYRYKDINGNWNFDEKCEYVTREIIKECIKHDVYVEINANGLRKAADIYDRSTWKYPYVRFWEIAKEYKDLKILIGADAHEPFRLFNENVREVIKFSEELGLNIKEKMEIKH